MPSKDCILRFQNFYQRWWWKQLQNMRVSTWQLINVLFLMCLFILAIMQLNYDMVRNGMGVFLNWFLNWPDHGSWHSKLLNYKIHWILWILRGLRFCAKKDQNHNHFQKVWVSEFSNICCSGTVILVLQLVAEVEERKTRECHLSRPIRKPHLSVDWSMLKLWAVRS